MQFRNQSQALNPGDLPRKKTPNFSEMPNDQKLEISAKFGRGPVRALPLQSRRAREETAV
jgi:hypothetical protein